MEDSKKELLIVDDNPENLKVLGAMLREEGYGVRVAKNGKQALTSIETLEPDLMLLDVHMPEMDGFELCKHIRENPKYNRLPIIFLSALDDTFNKSQGFRAGANDYMTKPFDLEEVKIRVDLHLSLRSSRLECERLMAELKNKDMELQQLREQLGQ